MPNFINYLPLIELAWVSSIIGSYLFTNKNSKLISLRRVTIFLILLVILLFPLHLLPFEGIPLKLPLISYIRAATGDLSFTTLILCTLGLSRIRNISIKKPTIVFIAGFSIIFYPLALGISMFDPYSFGYGSNTFLLAIIIFAGLLIIKNYLLEALIIAIAMIAWSLHWHESANFWDYLIDPFIAAWAIIMSLRFIIRSKSSII